MSGGVEGCHLEALHLRGFEITVSVRTYRAFCAFLLAHLLVEVSASNADLVLRQPPGSRPPSLHTLPAHPVLASGHARKFLAAEVYPAKFERSLDVFLHSVSQLPPWALHSTNPTQSQLSKGA